MRRAPPDSGTLKACCAALYEHDLVRLLLGDSYHPGGSALTRRLSELLGIQPGERVLDLASGPGTTALLLAREAGAEVHGIDLSHRSVARGAAAAREAGLAARAGFEVADGECLPFRDASFDAAICECALCTFPSKSAALAEAARVLRPGGRLGIADVTLDPGRLHPDLGGLGGWVACLAGALTLERYTHLVEAAGLRVVRTERQDGALAEMTGQVEARLLALAGALPSIPKPERLRELAGRAREAVAEGTAGYALLVARRAEEPGNR